MVVNNIYKSNTNKRLFFHVLRYKNCLCLNCFLNNFSLIGEILCLKSESNIHSYEENLNRRKKFNTLTNNSIFFRILETGSRWGTDSGLRCWPRCWPRNRYLCHTPGTSCRCTQRPGAVDIPGVSAAGCRPASGTCCPLYNRPRCPVYSDLHLPHSYPQCTHFRSGNLDLQ